MVRAKCVSTRSRVKGRSDNGILDQFKWIDEFRDPGSMPNLFECVSVELCDEESGEYELGYAFRDEYPIWPDVTYYLSVDIAWHVAFSGAVD